MNDILYPNAKINIYLKIKNKIGNLHEIESIFLPVSIYDRMEITSSDKFKVEYFKYNEKININNCLLQKMNSFFNISPNIKIRIDKNIPSGAGLGGGSSNAGFYFNWLCKNKILKKSKKNLKNLYKLGSDIPFFIENKPSYVHGVGNKIKNIDFIKNNVFFVVVYPNIHNDTKDLFDKFDKTYDNYGLKKNNKKNIKFYLKLFNEYGLKYLSLLENDFEKVILDNGKIYGAIQELLKNSVKNIITGSGSSIVGIYDSYNEAFKDFSEIKRTYRSSFVAKII